MSFVDGMKHRLRVLLRRDRYDDEIAAEARFHVEAEAMQQRSAGRGDREAEGAARRRFGNMTYLREEVRRIAGIAVFDRLLQDVGYALRQLRRSPGFTATVVFTLAAGIGANATMFGIIDRLLLRAPEGISNADRVFGLYGVARTDGRVRSTSYPSYMEFRALTDVFDGVTAYASRLFTLGSGAEAIRIQGTLVTDDYFSTLGVRPVIGRFFTSDETHEPTGAPVVVLGYGFWQRRFGGSTSAIGRSLELGDNRYTIIGVTPRGFSGARLYGSDLWIPMAAAGDQRWGTADWTHDRGTLWLTAVARLRPGVTPERAAARVDLAWTAWRVRDAETAAAKPVAALGSLIPGRSGNAPEYRVAGLLAGVSLVVLLIACANVANLLVARAFRRRREIAVRLALGVSRGRLATLLLTESLTLAMLGGVGALLMAYWGGAFVRSMLFFGLNIPPWPIDGRTLAFTGIVAVATGVVSGFAPAWHAGRASFASTLKEGAPSGARYQSRARVALLVIQGALSLVLVTGTGLFVRSLERIGALHLGFDLDRLLVVQVDVGGAHPYNPADLEGLYQSMYDRVQRIPGVESASLSIGMPFMSAYAVPLFLPGRDSLPGEEPGTAPYFVRATPEFLGTMGTRVLRGRPLTAADDRGPPVAVVNAEMARLFWPDEDAIGKCFRMENARAPCVQVVGIAEDTHLRTVLAETRTPLQYYIPLGPRSGEFPDRVLVIRSAHPAQLAATIRRELQALRPDLPFVHVIPLEDRAGLQLRPWRLGATMFGLFGALALLIASVGMYSVMHYSVAQRLHEMGIRVALGAQRADIFRLVIAQTLAVVSIACIVGLSVVLLGGRLWADLLYRTSPRDPAVLAFATSLLLASGIAASLLPAWRATRVDPVTALRAD